MKTTAAVCYAPHTPLSVEELELDEPREGEQGFRGDVRDLFSLHPANTFLLKMSYWLNR